MSDQPAWKFVANLGDVNAIDHGGLFLYQDETGVYGFECERLERLDDESEANVARFPNMSARYDDDRDDDDSARWEVRRVCLDRCKLVRSEPQGRAYLVSFNYSPEWRYPVSQYQEWFADSLASVADFIGTTEAELIEDLCSDDGKRRLLAYQAIGDYHGWDNLDSYPLTLTRAEVEARYTKGEVS